jgi:hypothetical protein
MNTNHCTNGFLLIFKIYFYNIRGAPFENHWPRVCVTKSSRMGLMINAQALQMFIWET